MSLINDALRKAQSERGHTSQPPGSPPITPPHAGRSHAPQNSGPWIIIAVASILILGGIAVWLALRSPAPQPQQTVQAAPPPAPVTKTPDVSIAPVPAEPTSAQIAVQQPAITTPAPEKSPATPAPQKTFSPAPEVSPAPVAPPVAAPAPREVTISIPAETPAKPVVVAPPPSAPPAPIAITPAEPVVVARQQDPRILAFIESAHIGGLRASADDARVLINSRVFRIGSVVSRDLKLKLLRIEATRLVFADEFGVEYERNLNE